LLWPGAQQSAILERIIVKVNGEILTQSQLENKQIEALRDQNKQIENRKALSNEDVRKALIEITPALLVEEVDSLLLVQRARELNIKYSDEEFKRNIENIKKQNPDTIKTEADLVRALKEAGLTMETLRQNFETAYLKYVVEQREIARNITLTEEEARQYYKAHPQEFMTKSTVTLREIMVSVPTQGTGSQATFNAAIQESAKTKIDAIRARAVGAKTF
jgi:parvulin-like peptidyl-prolyl isomerase